MRKPAAVPVMLVQESILFILNMKELIRRGIYE